MAKLIRPFPWKCGNCREKAIVPVVVDYEVELKHDGQTYPIKVAGLEILQCEKCQTRMLLDEAWFKIEDELRKQVGLLSPNEIKAKRMELGLSEQELADTLQIELQLVAAWESGMQLPSRAMNRQLLAFFNVPAVRDYYRGLEEKPRPQSPSAPTEPLTEEAIA